MLGVYVCLWSWFVYFRGFVVFIFILTGNLLLWTILCNLSWYCRDRVVPEDCRGPQSGKLGSNLSLWSLIHCATLRRIWWCLHLFQLGIHRQWCCVPFAFTSQGWINTVFSTVHTFCALALDYLSPLLGSFLYILILETIVPHKISSMTSKSSSEQ